MENLKIVESSLTEQQSIHIKQVILPQIFSIENNALKLNSEYKIIFLNEISCLKKYFIKNVLEDEIIDIMCNIYKLDNWNDEKKKFMNKIIKVDSLYYLIHNLVLQDDTTYYYLVFILQRDVNNINLKEKVETIKDKLEKSLSDNYEELKTISEKMTEKFKKNNENFSKNYDELKELLNKLNLNLSETKRDILDLNSVVFPSGKGMLLL